jgi:hypothetical protein
MKYNVVKVFRQSCRRQILRRNVTESDARMIVKQYKSNMRSMVVYEKSKSK